MKYKPLDKVKIKSLDWYNENKDKYGQVFGLGAACFNRDMSCYCGSVLTIDKAFGKGCYRMKEDSSQWRFTDGMIEGLVEEEEIEFTEEDKYWCDIMSESDPTTYVLPQGYQFVDENGNVINATKIVLEKKKKEYPKTYEECCKVMNYCCNPVAIKTTHKEELIRKFQFLLLYRDAYWKIAGNWKPNFGEDFIYAIGTCYGTVEKRMATGGSGILLFPTEEMRDAFYENFKELIEICKELL